MFPVDPAVYEQKIEEEEDESRPKGPVPPVRLTPVDTTLRDRAIATSAANSPLPTSSSLSQAGEPLSPRAAALYRKMSAVTGSASSLATKPPPITSNLAFSTVASDEASTPATLEQPDPPPKDSYLVADSAPAGDRSSTVPTPATVVPPTPTPQKPAEKPPIKRWTQGRLIGQGAFGKVFHALNLDTGEIMAVKQVLLGSAETDMGKKQMDALMREIELLKELEHENIVRYLVKVLQKSQISEPRRRTV
ncbi:hypothetical protein HDU96_000908 [Phlyctochytrium bullatum]|nr:hypothetical protein HDU96_000908 [Phlyctochytrium bullatum]